MTFEPLPEDLQGALDEANRAAREDLESQRDLRLYYREKYRMPDELFDQMMHDKQQAGEFEYLVEKVEQWLVERGANLPPWHGHDLGRSVRAWYALKGYIEKGKLP